jgi:hypothetical protein
MWFRWGVVVVAVDIQAAIDTLLACVCDALAEHGRPVCRCGVTVGPPPIGPGECCACDTGPGGQASAHLERFYPADNLARVSRIETCRSGGVAADISLVVTRCYPTLDEQGNVPSVEDTAVYAAELHDDMQIAWNAVRCCSGLKLLIRDMALDSSPQAGCAVFALRVTVDVTPTVPPLVIGS